MVTQQEVSEKLLWGLWRSIDDLFKEKYAINIWEHFENAIRSASYCGELNNFLDNIKKRIPITIQAKYSKDILDVIESGQDEQILNWLRTQTTYLVMVCRVANQERRELLQQEHKEHELFNQETEEIS